MTLISPGPGKVVFADVLKAQIFRCAISYSTFSSTFKKRVTGPSKYQHYCIDRQITSKKRGKSRTYFHKDTPPLKLVQRQAAVP